MAGGQIAPFVQVYPRVCGGTVGEGTGVKDDMGLSPRVRGNPQAAVEGRLYRRSIPACAGEPKYRRNPHRCRRVYPRVCGGTLPLPIPGARRGGLSPRVRGNRQRYGKGNLYRGSIPACAGEPILPGSPPCPGRVYPRVCGGTQCRLHYKISAYGLSPRVRGNLSRPAACAGAYRSIPACAGEPAVSTSGLPVTKVYPRVCGGTRRRT